MNKLLFVCAVITAFATTTSCNKDKSSVESDPGSKIITITKSFPEINLNFQYRFSKNDSTVSEAKISGDFYYLDKNTTFYTPESSEYFTIRTQHNTNNNIQCLVSGQYDTRNDSLKIFYVKVDLSKPNPFEN